MPRPKPLFLPKRPRESPEFRVFVQAQIAVALASGVFDQEDVAGCEAALLAVADLDHLFEQIPAV